MINCKICSDIKKLPIIFWEDIKRFGSPDFIKERWNLHFGFSALIAFLSIWFISTYIYINEPPLLFNLFIGWAYLFSVNFVREGVMSVRYKAPFDIRDVRMGAYGGLIGSVIFKIFQMIVLT
tara:strand:- start:3703 stop:4068 length:366 start_codon:yes stop_codon:yes gene_type:complete